MATFLEILKHSAGYLRHPSTNLVTAPHRLKLINLSHVDQNFHFNAFPVVKLPIKIIRLLAIVLELAAVLN